MNRGTPTTSSSGRRATNFPWSSLPTLSREQMELASRLAAMIPVPAASEAGLVGDVQTVLEDVTGTAHDIHFYSLEVHRSGDFAPDVGDHFVSSFHLPPSDARGVISIDGSVVESWLESLLDEEPARPRQLGQIDPRDFGVTTYVLLRVVQHLAGLGGPPISLPSTPPDVDVAVRALAEDAHVAELVFVLSNDESVGLMRVFLTTTLVERLIGFAESSLASSGRLHRRYGKLRVGGLPVRLSVSMGRVRLTGAERSMLRVGDALIPAEHALDIGDLEGTNAAARVYLPRSRSWLPAKIDTEGEAWCVELTGVEPNEPNEREDEMSDDVYSGDEMTNAATMALQTHSNVDVEIRVGRATVNITELSSLQTGQVLELDRGVGDAVDLVVNNNVIGRGELVEIEGQLGVRVLSLVSR